MGRMLSLPSLSGYLRDAIGRIRAVRAEAEEIQVGFQSAHATRKAEREAALDRVSAIVAERLDQAGPALGTRVAERTEEERRIAEARRVELRETVIPEAARAADEALREGQDLTARLRGANPRLDRREEDLKAERKGLEAKLSDLNDRIRSLSRGLGIVLRFVSIVKLDRERQRTIGKLQAVQKSLRDVRQEWASIRDETQSVQEELQARWRRATLAAAQGRAELEVLDDDARRGALVRARSVRHALAGLREPIECPAPDLAREIDAMIELNARTAAYEEGLGSACGLLAWLDGVASGLGRFDESVKGLIHEQEMHSEHLDELDVEVPDETLAFHEVWEPLRRKVVDDGRLCEHPEEFVAAIKPAMEDTLSETRIRAMFEGLGEALKRATAAWG
ncbi:MAG: hypothetical protein JXP34_05700 [Planctomycetes bacterium]|nr:hypothetical protein [Planctomycetota bacterium]